jgi:threonine dehydrogenase-like Zn-dependent dehydrogenase
MTALEWHGNKDVRVVQRFRPAITEPRDIIVRVTYATVCGSDLHLYHKEFDGLEPGDILGHEAVGIIEQVGPEVKNFKAGDRVVVSAVIACGECFYCKQMQTSLCLSTNPDPRLDAVYGQRLSGIFGYSHLLGGYEGCQAEFVRVPIGDVNCLKIPDTLSDAKAILLSDIACTGWHANELAEVKEGQTVAVWGCGPVGLMAMMWAKFRGASRIFAIDNLPYRLQIAKEQFGAETIDYSKADVVSTIRNLLPLGPDVCIEAVGFRYAKSVTHAAQRAAQLETDTPDILSEVFKSVRLGGHVSIVGDYYNLANAFPIGAMMEKGITIRGSQVYVHKYWKQLMEYFVQGKVDPSFVFTHEMPLEKVDEAYRIFDQKQDGAIKILLKAQQAERR